MKRIEIRGGKRLEGSLRVQGAKNSALPLLAASVLHRGTTVLQDCPRLSDVEVAVQILEHLGCAVRWNKADLLVDASGLQRWDIPEKLMGEMRSSVFFLGPLLARTGRAQISCPGGCALGPRPIDLHLAALAQLGTVIHRRENVLDCEAPGLQGAAIHLRLPSVGATENAILAACGAEGETTICNAAREPELEDLQAFLNAMGFQVKGCGTPTVQVAGRAESRDTTHKVMPDRIAAATYLAAAASAGGQVELNHVEPLHVGAVLDALTAAGCAVVRERQRVILSRTEPLTGAGVISTAPYPGFPTDAQAPLMAAMLQGRTPTLFVENIFSERYRHVEALTAMGADILLEGRLALVRGSGHLQGARVEATDLRGGAALLVAGLAAEGTTSVGNIWHIYRGYEDPVRDLKALGAEIRLTEEMGKE